MSTEATNNNLVFVFGTFHFNSNLNNLECREALNNGLLWKLRDYEDLLCVRQFMEGDVEKAKHISLGYSKDQALKHRSIQNMLNSLSEGTLDRDE